MLPLYMALPERGKTTTLTESIRQVLQTENQVLVSAPSNAAVDLLLEKLTDLGISALRIGHPARVTEQSLSKTLDARIAAHPSFHELKTLRKRMEELRNMALKYKRKFGVGRKSPKTIAAGRIEGT